MDDALDVGAGGVDGGVEHEACLVDPEVGAPFLDCVTLNLTLSEVYEERGVITHPLKENFPSSTVSP